jgi:FixJ family two-component response regulator
LTSIHDEHLIIVIRPDATEREALSRQLAEHGLCCRVCKDPADGLELLGEMSVPVPACVVSPLSSDGVAGLDFQRQVNQLARAVSIVFLDAPLTIEDVVDAMRQGAVGVVDPDGDPQRLVAYVEEGIERSRRVLEHEGQCRDTLERLGGLNVGEHQVLQGIMLGKLNKEIARYLRMSIRTIEQRRRELFRKMEVQNAAVLVRKVTEALRTPVPWEKLNPNGRWLETVRNDFVRSLVRPSSDTEPGDARLTHVGGAAAAKTTG